MTKIDLERLSILRRRKGLSRSQLAKRSRVSPRQIQRIEDPAPSSGSVREQTLVNLATALQVEPRALTGEIPLPNAEDTSNSDVERVQIGALIRPKVRLAYSLVKSRYGANATDLINMAPLFFVLLAEGSLAWRKEKLLELEEAAERMSKIGDIAHLVYAKCANRIYESTASEKNSIEKADVFGQDLSEDVYNFGYDGFENNPFSDHLRKIANDLGNPDAVQVDSLVGLYFPDYEVCCSDLDAIAGDSPRARLALTSGRVQLSDIPQELMADTVKAARVKWLEDKSGPEPGEPILELTEETIKEVAEEIHQEWLLEQAIAPEMATDDHGETDSLQRDPTTNSSEGEDK